MSRSCATHCAIYGPLILFGRRCRVISMDDLIRAKEALGREKDLLAVKELKAIREKQSKA